MSTFFTLRLALVATFSASAVFAAVNGPCVVRGTPGACLPSAQCSSGGGTATAGFCPDDVSDVKCCTKPCGNGGQCRPTSSCGGTTLSGLCPGPDSIRCCVPPPSGGGASGLSAAGAAFIAGFEGFEPNFYTDAAVDVKGVRTIGYGHACQTPGECDGLDPPITEAEGQALLQEDAAAFVSCINDLVDVPLNQNQFDALVSFTYNLGCGNFDDIAPFLNRNDFSGATTQMKKYVNAGGQQLPGLVRRRNEEVALFNS